MSEDAGFECENHIDGDWCENQMRTANCHENRLRT